MKLFIIKELRGMSSHVHDVEITREAPNYRTYG